MLQKDDRGWGSRLHLLFRMSGTATSDVES